jgi:hypothetical protein
VSDWTRIADHAGVAEISAALDLATGSGDIPGAPSRLLDVAFLGLGKAEAGSVTGSSVNAETRSKQGM